MKNIIRNMTEITRCGVQYRTEQLAPMGLKACHGSYLLEVSGCPGISQEQLAKRICINKSNVARQVVVLEEGGFLLRKPCQADKRIMKLYPTEKTLELLPQLRSVMATWQQLVTTDLSEEEQQLLGTLLEKMKVNASAWMEAE